VELPLPLMRATAPDHAGMTYDTPSYTTATYSLHYGGSAWSAVPMARPAAGSPRSAP